MEPKDIKSFISKSTWDKFENIINNFIDNDVGKQEIIWARKVKFPGRFGEDNNNDFFIEKLEVLCNYNAFRNWPMNKDSASGETDLENLCILISRKQLETKGYINSQGYIDYDWSEDRFILHGVVYKPSGDTEISQTTDHNILFQIILKRDREVKINFASRLIKGSDDMYFMDIDSRYLIEHR